MANLSKKVIDSLSDTRFPVVTFIHDLHREPLDTQEIFIYTFLRYVDFMATNYREGMLHPDFYSIGIWCNDLINKLETINK